VSIIRLLGGMGIVVGLTLVQKAGRGGRKAEGGDCEKGGGSSRNAASWNREKKILNGGGGGVDLGVSFPHVEREGGGSWDTDISRGLKEVHGNSYMGQEGGM